jgi:M6 family metalloprotease-like protein
MKRTMEKRLLSIAISISLIFGSMLSAPMQASAATVKRTMANVIIFVEFSDTEYGKDDKHAGHETAVYGQCFRGNNSAAYAKSLFDGDASHPIALKQYLKTISYGQLQVENVFPQISGDKIAPYRLKNPAAYYTNTGNGDNGDQKMIKELIENNAIKLPSGATVDYDGDGAIDNLTIVYTTNKDADAHKSTYKSGGGIGGYAVKDYNMLPEYSVFMMKAVGVACHEFLHTVGYPDLYRENAVSNGRPVGEWGIMASAGRYLQYPLAYLRGGMTNWFTIPTVEQSGQQSLYAASKTTINTKDQQAVILKTSYSDSEFFVLEYRKQAQTVDEYESKNLLQASGLIIYRVNTRYSQNYYSSGDMIYVFRPGDSYNANGREKALKYVSTGALASELGRTSYGSSDPNATLTDGAITYSDGTNSGIVISNVGSNAGDKITFDITYHPVDEYWTTIAELDNNPTYEMDSYMDTDGTIYSLQRKGNKINGPVSLYQYNTTGWKELGTPLSNVSNDFVLGKYNGNLYAGCVNTSTWNFKLFRWNNSGWVEVFASPANTCLSNAFTMTSAEDGIYFSYLDSQNHSLTAYRYTTSGVVKLGDMVAQEDASMATIGSASITAEQGKVVLGYSDNNQINVKIFNSSKNAWEAVGTSTLKGDGIVKLHRNQIYLMRSESLSTNGGELYQYNLSTANGTWTRIGPGAFSEESAYGKDICFIGNVPYVAMIGGVSRYGKVINLIDGQWGMLGNKITNEKIENLQIFSKGNDLYAIYCTDGNKVYIKSHFAKEIIITPDENPDGSGGNTGDNPGGDSNGTGGNDGNTGGNTGSTGGNSGSTGGNTGSSGDNSGNTGNTEGNGGTTGNNPGTSNGSGDSSQGNGGTIDVPELPVNTSDIKDLSVIMLKSNSLRLSWNSVPNIKSYEVYYSTSPDSGFKRLTTTKKTFYDFKRAKCGQTYYFQVRTMSKVGKQKVYSDFCPAVSGRTVLNGTVDAYIAKTTYNSITIKWNKVRDAKKYEIYYATSPGGEYHFLKSQGGRSFTHKKLTTGDTYYYQIRPVRDSYKGEFSSIVSSKTVLNALTKLQAKPSGAGRIKVSWKKVPGAKAYVILRADSEEGPYEQIGVSYKPNYLDAGLPDATGYYYKVYGVSGAHKTNVEGPVWQLTKAAKK